MDHTNQGSTYMETQDSFQNMAQIYRPSRRHITQGNSLQKLACKHQMS